MGIGVLQEFYSNKVYRYDVRRLQMASTVSHSFLLFFFAFSLTLVLLAITFSPKRVLAPATEKGHGETGALVATGDGKRKVFPQECENHWQSVMARRVAITK
jgi:hypothetical protein